LLDKICKLARIATCSFYKATKQQSNKATKQQSNKATSVKSKNKSFTLLEIVFTIVIIGVLLALFLPVMSSIKLAAQKVKDQSNLKTITAAWRECVINYGREINSCNWQKNPGYVSLVMERLAGCDGSGKISDMVLNDPYVYISSGDKYAGKIIKDVICFFNGTEVREAGWYNNVSNIMTSGALLISYCLITGLPAYVPLDTTPFAFTRGLRVDGKWDEKAGLYGSKGGFVVFCVGHTTWFDGSKSARFLRWDQSGYTSDIREAVPNSAFITCGNPGTKTNYESDGKLVILHCSGTGGN
jgi:competence protein ComGC